MLYVRYHADGSPSYGVVRDDWIEQIAGDLFGVVVKTGRRDRRSDVTLLAPCQPGKLVAVGLNYKSHLGDRPAPAKPEFFLKTPTSLLATEGDILIPKPSQGNVHYEGELVVVMGRRGKHIPAAQAADYIFGYSCGNDVSERDWQRGDLQWARAKSSDTFSPLGPAIATGVDPRNLRLQTRLNGRVVQEQSTSDLIFDVYEIVAQLSEVMTLEPGDAIYTGTPGHTDRLRPGDTVEVEIDGIGILRNRVKKEE